MKPGSYKWFFGWQSLAVCLFGGALYAVQKGQDSAWDLKNYHIYNAWALLTGRMTTDLGAVGLQGYFNPLLDVPYYWLGRGWLHHWPRVLSGFQGLWYGALVFVVIRIAERFTQIRGRSFALVDLLAVTIGVSGTMVLSQTGSCTNEVPLAVLVLLGFYVVLPLAGAQSSPSFASLKRAALAGLLCGIAAGLKPTAVVFTPALAAALWLSGGFRLSTFKLALVFGVAAFAAFLVTYGWWGFRLYALTGNPVFPMFNQVFHSSWVPPLAGTDRQFMPKDLVQWLFYPFFWIRRNAYQGGNLFADSRYAAAMIAATVLLAAMSIPRLKRVDGAPALRLLLIFMMLSYILWLNLYSILRYAVSIEVLTGLLVLFSIQETLALLHQSERHKWLAGVMITATLLLVGFSRPTDWGHSPYASVAFDVTPPPLAPNAMVLLVGQPNAYVAPFFDNASSSRFVGITWLTSAAAQYRLGELTRRALKDNRGPMYAVTRDVDKQGQAQLLRILPTSKLVDCKPIDSAMERTRRGTDLSGGLRLCRVDLGAAALARN